MLLKSTVSVQQEVEINLETPAFFKWTEYVTPQYLGVIEECTISIFISPGQRTSIANDATERKISDIHKFMAKGESISEEEFFEALDKALKDFNFKPSLRVVNAKEGSEVSL
jgi:hypothetical protein